MFRGNAIGLTGRVTKPYQQSLGEHACLRIHADFAECKKCRSGRFALHSDITYDAIYSDIDTEQTGSVYRTVVDAGVENLNIRNRFTADRIIARMESVYDSNDYSAGRRKSRVLPVGCKFVNVKIDGKPYMPRVPRVFGLDRHTIDEFFAGKRDDEREFFPAQPGEAVHVDDFGTIYFANWNWVDPVEQDEQRLTMVRLALGSPYGAEIDAGRVDADGSGWPP
jgi:hypothetical protein